MAKSAGKLTGRLQAVAVKALVAAGQPGAHADGGNLYLRIAGAGAGKWTLRYMVGGKSREMGLGPYDADGKAGKTLKQAREAAEEPRAQLRAGLDPMAERDRKDAEAKAEAERLAAQAEAKRRTFADVAALYTTAHSAGWRNAKHRAQWTSTLATYAEPHIGKMPVDEIGTDDVLAILNPIWTAKPETASRVRGRVEAVIDYAMARGWRETANPARWRGHLANLLPSRSKVRRVKHHPALSWQDMRAFMERLRKQGGTAARALEFCILTALRTEETLGARWSEIDLAAAVWTVPGERMKAGREHRVPLSDAALAVLATMAPLRPEEGDGYVFPGAAEGRPLSEMAMLMLLRRMNAVPTGQMAPWRDPRTGKRITVHGFRSTFRDWTEETTSTPHAVAEAALAHTIKNEAEAAYRRGDLFAKRARLMAEWADYCAKAPAEVHALPVARAEAAG